MLAVRRRRRRRVFPTAVTRGAILAIRGAVILVVVTRGIRAAA
jgi:hypothetical protein